MKENLGRLLLIACMVLLAGWAVSDLDRFRLGPDLSGGTILIYQVDKSELRDSGRFNMEELLPALKRRLDPAGLYNYVIRALGDDRVEIIMPKAKAGDVDLIKRRISTVGQLQFKILATTQKERHRDLIEDAEDAWPNKIVGPTEAPIGTFIRFGEWNAIPDNEENAELIKQAKEAWPNKEISSTVRFVPRVDISAEEGTQVNPVTQTERGQTYVLARWNNKGVERIGEEYGHLVRIDENGNRYVLVVEDEYDVTGEYLSRVEPTMQDGEPAVAFNFNSVGAGKFYQLTSDYRPEPDGFQYQLGVVLDNRLRSAPSLRDRISGSGVIEGGFTSKEVDELVSILRAGRLPFALQKSPSSEYQIAPLLGKDTIYKGATSILAGLLFVLIFMAMYYRFAGFVAILALSFNLLFTVALMVLFKATWTLPGLAGLVLTVGMSVDANVLIYERIREELNRGASLGMAIRNGYEKVFWTIFDSNTTTIITGIILYAIGTDQVKGFAVTLILGILTSMFCALYVTRVIFETMYTSRKLNRLNMAQIMTNANYNFLAPRKLCYMLSLGVIVVGLAAAIYRGQNNFDIDFTGGTMIGLHLKEDLDSGTVRKLATDGGLSNVAVEKIEYSVSESDGQAAKTTGSHYVIRTTERDPDLRSADQNGDGRLIRQEFPGSDEAFAALDKDGDKILSQGEMNDAPGVRDKVAAAFKDYLELPHMSFTDPQPVDIAELEKQLEQASEQDKAQLTTLVERFRSFDGGQQSTITFDEFRSPDFLAGNLNDVLRILVPEVADPSQLYALVPVGEAVQPAGGVRETPDYKEYRLAMSRDLKPILERLQTRVKNSPEFDQFSQFGAQVAGETQNIALAAIIISWICIIIYVAFRFGSWAYGLAGVIALVHDVLVATGVFALVSLLGATFPALNSILITDMKIDLNVIAALLTLVGYSINDTIVIFDRIREIKGKSPRLSADIVNSSVNATLSRTIITTLTTLMVVTVLFIFGGAGLRGFSFVLVIGLLAGTYSTIFIASPLLLAFTDMQAKRKEQASKEAVLQR